MSPAVLVMVVIIFISAAIVVAVMRYGTRTDGDFHGSPADSAGVAFWTKRAEKREARHGKAAAANATVADGASSDEDAEAEKARKRAEALARKAARQAKDS